MQGFRAKFEQNLSNYFFKIKASTLKFKNVYVQVSWFCKIK